MKECAKVNKLLSRYLDKETGDADTIMVEAHLSSCSLCKKEFEALIKAKELVAATQRKALPRDYMVSRLREKITIGRHTIGDLILAHMGRLARRLIPVPVAAIALSVAFLIFMSAQSASKHSLEDYMFSGTPATTEAALELILGTQN